MKSFAGIFPKIALALTACCFLLPASAGDRPCTEDVKKFCADVQPGEGRIAKCLLKNQEGLSEACRAHQKAAWARMKTIGEACKEDTERFCSSVEPGEGRILRCLQKNKESLTPECSAELTPK